MFLPSHVTSSFWLFQVEVENFVLRVAAEFSSRKEQLVFLINNYDMMLGVLMVQTPHLPSSLPRVWLPPLLWVLWEDRDDVVLFRVLFLVSGPLPGQAQ